MRSEFADVRIAPTRISRLRTRATLAARLCGPLHFERVAIGNSSPDLIGVILYDMDIHPDCAAGSRRYHRQPGKAGRVRSFDIARLMSTLLAMSNSGREDVPDRKETLWIQARFRGVHPSRRNEKAGRGIEDGAGRRAFFGRCVDRNAHAQAPVCRKPSADARWAEAVQSQRHGALRRSAEQRRDQNAVPTDREKHWNFRMRALRRRVVNAELEAGLHRLA